MFESSDSDGSETSSDVEELVSFALKNVEERCSCSQDEFCEIHQLSPTDGDDLHSTQSKPSKIVPDGQTICDADSTQMAVIDRRAGPVNHCETDSSDDDSDVEMMDISGLNDGKVKVKANSFKKTRCMKFGKYKLSSSLCVNMNRKDLYIDQLTSTAPLQLAETSKRLQDASLSKPPPLVDISRNQLKKQRRQERDSTKGRKWYNLPATEMTEERQNDLMVIQMRKVLDPKRFYKGPDIRGALPKYFQMGTIVEGRADFYSGRIPKKNRKQSLVDELLADAQFRRYNKKKYAEILEAQPKRRSKAMKHMKRQKKAKK